jgi:D-glycero-alpha-D-manno-heptose 1-phosphate guanylyltransferase
MDLNDLTPAILAGGLGTRLRDALPGVPKVLAPVAGRPFVTHLLDRLAGAGFREVVLLTGHGHDEVRGELGEAYGRLRLTYSREREPLGTGGAVRAALPLIRSSSLLLNGDSYLDLDPAALPRFHASHGMPVSVALTRVEDASRYGNVRLGKHDQVVRFEEKTSGGEAGWVNAGVYLFERAVIEAIPADRPVSLEREVLPAWVSRGQVFGLRAAGRFIDIGTPESFARAGEFFLGADQRAVTHVG